MITQDYVTLVPAYGRDYKSAAAVKADFLTAGVDFKIQSVGQPSAYCSVRDFAYNVKVCIRYNRLTRVVIVTAPSRKQHLSGK